MKTHSNLAIVFLSSIALCQAQQATTAPSPTPYSIVSNSRTANSRRWERTFYELSPSGQVLPHVQRYTELATGLCYQRDGQWLDSQEQINILPDGTASVKTGSHQANWPADIYDGTITLVTPDGLRLTSRPACLSYDNGTNTVLLAELTNSIGQLISSNQVLYPNAFVGVSADLLYTYRKSGFEQDVIFRAQPPAPEQFGMTTNCRLQLLTEFFNSPNPVESVSPVNRQDGLQDTTLTFGKMNMIQGKAFIMGTTTSQNNPDQVPVYKSWITVDGRTFLIEQVPYQRLSSQLAALPQITASAINSANSLLHKVSSKRLLPPVRLVEAATNSMQIAKIGLNQKKGLVFDYVAIDSNETNFTFQGDTTYYVSGEYYLSGTTVLEGGTVIKMNYGGEIVIMDFNGYENDTIDCETDPYLPAIFTSFNDNTVGDQIGDGDPSSRDVADFLYIGSTNIVLHDVRFNYCGQPISYYVTPNWLSVQDCQFVQVSSAISAYNVALYNVLIANNTVSRGDFVFLDGPNFVGEQVTANDDNLGFISANPGATIAMTNCIITSANSSFGLAPNGGTLATNAVVCLIQPSSPVFQTVGGGNYYLTNGSPYRSAGTTNIDPALLADIQTKTTWPPIVYSDTNISSLTTLSPAVPRDTNSSPDLGYLYDPLDYVFGGCDLHSNLTITTGTAIGWFQENGSYSGEPYAISLENGANLSFNGNATQPCYFANYVMVQEGGNGNWTDSGWMGAIMFNGSNTNQEPQLSGDFTKWTLDSDFYNIFRDNIADGAGGFKNCEFYDCNITTYDMQYLNFTNCLFFRVDTAYWDQDYALSFAYENCTFYNGCLFMGRYSYDSGDSSSFWLIENTAFEGTAFAWADNLNADSANTLINYNAYNTNNLSWQTYPYPYPPTYGTNEVVGPNDVMVTNYNWESSWFGDFYLPSDSPLITNGSTNANVLGLYWFTTQTNQIWEGTNTVDIGYHYVASDTNGNPLATFGTNIPNYILYPYGLPTNLPPYIIDEPDNQTVMMGSNATFSVMAGGTAPLSYQWFWNGEPLSDLGGISGSESATLNLNATLPAQTGSYYVVVTNNFGSITSAIATLTVTVQASQIYPPADILPPNAYWNVTDISDPAQPVNIGELQAPFSEPNYPVNQNNIPPSNTPWHTNTTITVTEAYGTTVSGGVFGKGTVFKIDPAGDGAYPNEMVLSGNVLYGTTAGIGGSNSGTVFEINTNGLGFTNLFSFTNPTAQGSQPEAGLVLCGNTLYGTTEYGGQYGYGTVFSINTNGSGFNILYNFGAMMYGNDGAYPCAKLVLSGGMLYGTTSGGGESYGGYGTVFEVSTNSSDNTNGDVILYSFTGENNGDGANPQGELLLSGGVLYGTTLSGGANNAGTVFSVSTNAGSEDTILYSFGNTNMSDDGTNPCAGLVLSGTTLYGTTTNGGAYGNGTIFEVSTNPSDNVNGDTILHSFSGQGIDDDGAYPYAKLILFSNTLYGTTFAGGTNNDGTVFSINTNGSYTELYSFRDGADGQNPETALTLSGNTLFGTTRGDSALAGDPNYGTIFSVSTNGTNFTVLNTFSTAVLTVIHPFMGSDGAYPCSQLAISGSTYYGIATTVYGTTSGGGTNGYGTVFKVNTDGSGFADLYEFSGGSSDGAYPQTGLLISGNTLYGTTTSSIFKINTDGSDFICLTNVSNASQLVLSWSGDALYGTTTNGGVYGKGTVFSINTDGSDFTNLYIFAGGTNGAYPNAGLELSDFPNLWQNGSTVGTLYGTTYSGGISNKGTIFSINTDGSEFTPLYSFTGGNDGAYPEAGLLATNNNMDGNDWHGANYLYGTTASGGSNGDGTIFGIGIYGSGFTNICDFGGATGAGGRPEGKLALLGSTTLCGTTSGGGVYTNGTVFSINTDGSGFTDFFDFDETNGALPYAGLTLPVVDNPESIWSVDTTLNVSSGESNVECTVYIDNYAAVFVNGVLATNISTSFETANLPLAPYVHPGENDIRVVIGGDGDCEDYFTMFVTAEFGNPVYGTTYSGGNNNDGTVFELTTAGNESVLHSFSETPDGANPIGDLILSGNTLYGTTENGNGYYNTFGTIFGVNTDGSNFLVLHTFTNTPDGAHPYSGLVLSGTNLYGTTYYGGSNIYECGTVFSICTNGSNFQILHNFNNIPDGGNPYAGLVLSGNTLYGTTQNGGTNNHSQGTVFSINTDGSNFQVLYSFINQTDGVNPRVGLALSGCTLYGTTYYGGANDYGTVFSINTNGSGFTNLYSFSSTTNSTNFDGANPQAGLVLSGNTLYGTTYDGGAFGYGTLFSLGIDGTVFTNLLSFGGSDSGYGENPQADLEIVGSALYGTTYQGGAADDSGNGNGIVFNINTNGMGFINLYDFGGSGQNGDGSNPQGGLCFP